MDYSVYRSLKKESYSFVKTSHGDFYGIKGHIAACAESGDKFVVVLDSDIVPPHEEVPLLLTIKVEHTQGKQTDFIYGDIFREIEEGEIPESFHFFHGLSLVCSTTEYELTKDEESLYCSVIYT